jgi:hypothetical protein
MPRSTEDPYLDIQNLQDIGFLVAHIAPTDNKLYQALIRLALNKEPRYWIKTMTYLGELTVEETALTHSFVVDCPVDRRILLVSMTPTVLAATTSKLEIKFKKRVNDEAWQSLHDEKNLFISEGMRIGDCNSFLVPYLYNKEELNMDVISTGGASNLQVMIRGIFVPLEVT